MPCVLQDWVMELPFMQQSVLMTAVRGPDNIPKYHASKYIVRWYRRCVLKSSFSGREILNPYELDGGSFYGPSISSPPEEGAWFHALERCIVDYLQSSDELPHHFQMHMMHSAEIVGFKHPNGLVSLWWTLFYKRLAHDMHLWPETKEQMDKRLSDSRDNWLERADVATRD